MGQNQKNTQEPDMNQLRKVRREKLAELQQNGRDPFQITKFNQTHHSLEVKDLYEAHEAEILKSRQKRLSRMITKREEASWMQARFT